MFSFLPTALSFVTGIFKSKSSVAIDIILGLILVIVILLGYQKYKNLRTSNTIYKAELKSSKLLNTEYKNKINDLKSINDSNLKKLDTITSNYKNNIKLLQMKLQKDVQRVKVITKIKERIKYVKPEDNGKTAKVLKDTLEQIRVLNSKEDKK